MSVQKFPGFIDAHVHLRDPGAEHKEDFYTGSRAAVKGGVTFMIDMPNNPIQTISIANLNEKISRVNQKKAVCEIGFHYGTNGKNTDTFTQAFSHEQVYGLKLYCNHTTGEMLIEDLHLLEPVFRHWETDKPILVHAEGTELAATIGLARLYDRRLHVCHITQAVEVELVRRAKARGQDITSGVCPHHLFMTETDRQKMKGYATMKPPLGPQQDQDALWQGLLDRTIDIVETDHAPHTRQEKEADPPAFGVPGLETMVPLLFLAVKQGKINLDLLTQIIHYRPKEIFNIPDQPDTYVELDPDKPFIMGADGYESKCNWSPFDGWELYGQPQKVVIEGKPVVVDSKLVDEKSQHHQQT